MDFIKEISTHQPRKTTRSSGGRHVRALNARRDLLDEIQNELAAAQASNKISENAYRTLKRFKKEVSIRGLIEMKKYISARIRDIEMKIKHEERGNVRGEDI